MAQSMLQDDRNQAAWRVCEPLRLHPARYGVDLLVMPCGTQVIDLGVIAAGGLEAGLLLARSCLADQGRVSLEGPGFESAWNGPHVVVRTDHPVTACLGSQYAGWKIEGQEFFAMGSGPMRAAWAGEEIVKSLGLAQTSDRAVGVLECSRLPGDQVCQEIAERCRIAPTSLTLLAARTASLVGGLQIVARSVETALHKLHELDFDVHSVVAGWGVAPLPPCGPDDLQAIGWTNDAILYGARVCLWIDGEDRAIEAAGEKLPSCSSRDYGRPFARIFAEYDHDFYRVDPHLFSPAQVTVINRRSGRVFLFGRLNPAVLHASFASALG